MNPYRTPAPPPTARDDAAAKKRAESPLALARKGKAEATHHVWPNTDLPVAVVVLTGDDVEACHVAAFRHFVEELGFKPETLSTIAMIDAYQDEVALQVLHRACRDPKDLGKTFALDADDMRANTTIDERRLVFGWVQAHAEIYNPDPHEMSEEEVDAVVAAAKKGERTKLLGFGPHALATCLLTMVARQSTSPTGKCSTGGG